MRLVDLDIQYIGGDVVGDVIQRNTRDYRSMGRTFVQPDLIKGRLPKAALFSAGIV
jgi:hypothetical protein